MEKLGFADRATFQAGDFFADPLPEADMLVFGHVPHNCTTSNERCCCARRRRRCARAAW
jgi:hypothetical protein